MQDPQNDADFRDKHFLTAAMELVLGSDRTAPELCQKYGIKSQNDALIKTLVYKIGFTG